VLELDTVFEKLAQYAVSELGAKRLSELPFFSDPRTLSIELRRVDEMRDLLGYDDTFPLQPFPDLHLQLKKTRVSGAYLSGSDLIAVQNVLALSRKVRKYLDARREKYPLLFTAAEPIVSLEQLEKAIGSQIESTGDVKDGASALLSRIRRDMAQQRDLIRRRLESILRAMVKAGYAQDESLVLRQGKLVVPMKETYQNRLKGAVVDQSASGATVFMEPLESLELSNELRKLQIHEGQEIERILKSLTALVAERGDDATTNLERLADLDSFASRARYSLFFNGSAAAISDDGMLELKNAMHPLLLVKHERDKVVPLSVKMGGELLTLIITGPNAGGKTVALKTVGLLSLMHLHGLHIPGGEGSRIPMFTAVFTDIGDRQSIEQDLSTFSSHIQNLRVILSQANADSLVLLDEIGSATDPSEGGALAMGILKSLTQRRSLTLATTHIGLLKVFAHDEPGVENGSMVFDKDTLKPTYRFQMGIPGSSYAFEIAEKLGLPESVVRQAKSFIGEDRGRLDRLIFDLEDKLHQAEALHREAVLKESRYSGLIRLYESRLDAVANEAESRKRQILEEAEVLLREVNSMKEKILKEIRESKGEQAVVRQIHQELRSQKERIQSLQKAKKPVRQPSGIREGDWVAWPGHGGAGRVVSSPDNRGKLLVEWNDVRVQIAADELDFITDPKVQNARSGLVHFEGEKLSSDELDLRGMMADEAVECLEKYLGEAVAVGFSGVRIIHGKGTGVLRKKVQEYVEKHPLIKSHRLGMWNEGDTGVTVVEFK
jgi:DNA mismatch repair protein MutS2